jgi:two-component system, NtrC family, nitrogen regulation response regulator NtrX
MPTLLIVDDERAIRRTLREILEYEDYEVEEAEDGEQAVALLRQRKYDLALLDVKMPKRDGLEVLQIASDEVPEMPVIMISGHGTVETAVEATRRGAYDFIEKPPDLNRLLVTIRNALDRGQIVNENRRLKQAIADDAETELTPILGESPAIRAIKDTIERVAPTEARVLITGENGTGKELVARWIHEKSPRRGGAIVEVNCAAIPSELIESELFGHEKGSFTGAMKQRIGKFEQADGGTLFLDEVGDMSLGAQAKVLRALQESRITRVGGDRSIPVNVRVVAATNKDLLKAVEAGQFREDLYHRLAVILVHVPPLRERRQDVPLIARHIAEKMARRGGLPVRTFADDALDRLQRLDWRGNVRELHNVVERLLILSDGDAVAARDVERYVGAGSTGGNPLQSLLEQFDDFTAFRDRAVELFLLHQLEKHAWNVSRTAETIGIQRSHLYNMMGKYGIERGEG